MFGVLGKSSLEVAPHTLVTLDAFHLENFVHLTRGPKVSALGSRVGWTPARNNERTNERPADLA